MQHVLVLNASYEPLHVVPLRRALVLVWQGRAEIVDADPDKKAYSAGGQEFVVPSVVRLAKMIHIPFAARAPMNRRTLGARDDHVCQVAGCQRRGDTIDHLLPRSRGGTHTWENVVLMCRKHNNDKSNSTLEEMGWTLKKRPVVPRGQIVLTAQKVGVQQSWIPWLDPVSA